MFPYREGTKQTILETNYVKVIVFNLACSLVTSQLTCHSLLAHLLLRG